MTILITSLPTNLMPHRDPPHRHHILLTAIASGLLVFAPYGRRRCIVPCPLAFRPTTRVHPRTAGTTDVCASPKCTLTIATILLDVGQTLRAGAVARGASREFGAHDGGEGFAEERAQDREAGGEDADVAFNVKPDGGVDDGVCGIMSESGEIVREEVNDGWCIRLTGDVGNLKLCYEGHSNYTANDGTENILGKPTEFIWAVDNSQAP